MSSCIKPRILFSRCLGFLRCRYDGTMINDKFVKELHGQVECITVCPEVEIGLGVPRDPIRIVTGDDDLRLIQPSTGRDLTGDMEAFITARLDSLTEIDGFIFKSRSPSCGIRDVKHYDRAGNIVEMGAGLFARAVMARFPDTAIEDEVRLGDPAVRERFLTRIYAAARLREEKMSRANR